MKILRVGFFLVGISISISAEAQTRQAISKLLFEKFLDRAAIVMREEISCDIKSDKYAKVIDDVINNAANEEIVSRRGAMNALYERLTIIKIETCDESSLSRSRSAMLDEAISFTKHLAKR
jgi:hypothetical protein